MAGLGFARTDWLITVQLVITLGIFFTLVVIRLRWLAMLATVLFAFSLGWWRGQAFLLEANRLNDLVGVKSTVLVQATSDAFYNDRGQLEFEAGSIQVLSPEIQNLPGKVTASGYGEPAVFRGDTVQLSGRFYKTRGSKQLGVSFAQIEIVRQGGNWVDEIRRQFAAGVASTVPEPQASFGMGLLIGQRDTLPENVTLKLSAVGLTHIIAVSGYNLTIIVRGVRRILRNRSKYQSTMLSLGLIVIFLLMTGMSASIVRAAIISTLSILAWHYGRAFKPLLLLLLAGAITAAWNPFYIWSDIGWYLSFLAFFGVLIIAPLIHKRMFKTDEPKAIIGLMSESFTAFIMTAPLIMYIFGQISLIALPANLLIVPLVPFAMLFAVMAGLAGMILPAIGGMVALPATLLMTAMLDVVNLFSRLPNILRQQSLSLLSMLILYASIVTVTFVMWHKMSQNAKITDEITRG